MAKRSEVFKNGYLSISGKLRKAITDVLNRELERKRDKESECVRERETMTHNFT